MASIKIKFRPSTVEGKEGGLYFQIIRNRVIRQLNTDYKVYAYEWDAEMETVVVNGARANILCSIKERMEWDLSRFERIVRRLEQERRKYTADDVITLFHKVTKETSLFSFMHSVIIQLRQLGKIRTSDTYTATLKSFMEFREGQDVPLDGVNSDLMLLYEAHLKAKGVRMNTISFYMRILRAVYNRAVEKELTPQKYPFRHVYTGVDKTVKRAVPVKVIKALKELDLSMKSSLDFARDMFSIKRIDAYVRDRVGNNYGSQTAAILKRTVAYHCYGVCFCSVRITRISNCFRDSNVACKVLAVPHERSGFSSYFIT